jgi:phospholipid transport system transporter-binding protein
VTAIGKFQMDTATAGTLGVSGVLSFDTAAAALQAIEAALVGAAGAVVELDLAGLDHSDSAGLACVLAAVAGADRRGQVLRVVHMPEGMKALAQVCEVDRLMS